MATFKSSITLTRWNVSCISEHCALRTVTEKSICVLTLVTVCINFRAGKPPIKTSITILLSGSNCPDVRCPVSRHLRVLGRVEEPVDEPHHVPVNLESLASVMLLAVNLVSRVAGGSREDRETLGAKLEATLVVTIMRRKDQGAGRPPMCLFGHNETGGDLNAGLGQLIMVTAEIGERIPAPNKTGRYTDTDWFSISRLQLPAEEGEHGGRYLISKVDRNGANDMVTKSKAGLGQWYQNLFSHRQTNVPKSDRLVMKSRSSRHRAKRGKKTKDKRPDKGARLSRR